MSLNKSYIQLCNGEHHYFDEPFIPNIHAIAYSLCNINRFNGHVGNYSVAQHSILVAHHLPDELKLSGLLHDATEAYLGDVAAPLKAFLKSLGCWQYEHLEDRYHDAIDRKFNVDTKNPLIKEVDMRMLLTEAKSFGLDGVEEQLENIQAYDFTVQRIEKPEDVYHKFMSLFIEFGGQA